MYWYIGLGYEEDPGGVIYLKPKMYQNAPHPWPPLLEERGKRGMGG